MAGTTTPLAMLDVLVERVKGAAAGMGTLGQHRSPPRPGGSGLLLSLSAAGGPARFQLPFRRRDHPSSEPSAAQVTLNPIMDVAVASGPVTREDLGRSTWTLLHTLAAQLPEKPSKQQQKDVKDLINCLTRIYPCGECAGHFKNLVKSDPPVVTSGFEFSQWLCRVHNVVNRRLDKPVFNCTRVDARWGKLECGEEGEDACSLEAKVKRLKN